MVHGLGTDIIEVKRISASIDRQGQRFLDKLFTQAEQDYCLKHKESARHFAGRFAAKEAIAKALGTGFGAQLSWTDLEILNDDMGKPHLHLSANAKERLADKQFQISISHCDSYATAVALVQ